MKNLKVRVKLVLSFAAMLVLFAITIASGVIGVRSISGLIKDFYEGPYVVRGAANTMLKDFEQQQKYIFRAMSTLSYEVTNESVEKAQAAADAIHNEMETIKASDKENADLINAIETLMESYGAERSTILDYARNNRNSEASQRMEGALLPIAHQIETQLETLISNVNNKSNTMLASIDMAQGGTMALMISMGVISFLLSMLLCSYITKSLTAPINELRMAARELAQGNLHAKIGYQSQDELGQLAEDMRGTIQILDAYIEDISRGMRELAAGNLNISPKEDFRGDFVALRDAILHTITSLNDTLGRINQSADEVSSGSEQVSSGAQSLSQGATEQASEIQQLAATINEISSQINDNAANAESASEKAKTAADEIGQSNKQMLDMVQAMQKISNSSSEIGKIIKTIEDIAFQTNILALNAAVEAARAGAAGKGFAVVADEVRNLATKSSEAAKQTTALIETSVSAVDNGTKIADVTAKSLVNVVDIFKEVEDKINMIADASGRQAEAVGQVTQGVSQISSVVQTNSATAEESAASSEELSSQAQLLKNLVSRFHLKDQYMEAPATLSSDKTASSTNPSYGDKY